MKWSDGAPLTADDFVFWAEDIIGSREIVPVPSKIWTPGGQLVKVSKVDPLTVRFDFAVPYPSIITFLAYEARMYYTIPFAPRHYLMQFHARYNPDAARVAKAKNYDSWEKYFQYIYPDEVQRRYDVKVPTVDAWTMTEVDSHGNKYFERNPYYFKVDIAGNQLPYIDRQDRLLFANVEAINLTSIAGGLDYSQQDLVVENFAMYKQNEAQGKFKVSMWVDGRGQVLTDLKLNMNHPDPVMRQLMNTLKFRQALSLAINRQEINEAIFSGLATPRQATVRDDVSFYEDWMGKHFAEYDAARANRLLDEAGLKWDAARKVRLRPDGKPLELRLEYVEIEGPRGRICELLKDYFEAIGIQTTIKQLEQNLWAQRGTAGELDINIWNLDATNDTGFHAEPFTFGPYANDWWRWYNTGGKSGTEPPAEVKQFYALCEKFQAVPFGTEEYRRVGKELVTLHLNALWHVGIFGNMPKPTIIKAGLRNTPEKGLRMYAGYRFWMIYNGDQWYWENPE
jgi:peptide/nickel transport system substrate-binding protein